MEYVTYPSFSTFPLLNLLLLFLPPLSLDIDVALFTEIKVEDLEAIVEHLGLQELSK